jgi:hypothetical protein
MFTGPGGIDTNSVNPVGIATLRRGNGIDDLLFQACLAICGEPLVAAVLDDQLAIAGELVPTLAILLDRGVGDVVPPLCISRDRQGTITKSPVVPC